MKAERISEDEVSIKMSVVEARELFHDYSNERAGEDVKDALEEIDLEMEGDEDEDDLDLDGDGIKDELPDEDPDIEPES